MINFLHFLCGAAYGALALYVQWQYIILPVSLFSLGFICSILLTLGAGLMIPFFLMMFPRIMARIGSPCSKTIIFLLIAATCLIQVFFGAILIQAKNSANDIVDDSLQNLMEDWDGDGPESKQWDTLQQKYSCCGVHNYTDWSGLYQFQDFAEHFNATAPHPVPCSCMPQFDLLADDMTCGLYYDQAVDDVPFFRGCDAHLVDFAEFNLKLIGGFICAISTFEFVCLLWTYLFTPQDKIEYVNFK